MTKSGSVPFGLEKSQVELLTQWIEQLLIPANELRIDNAVHDTQPPSWRLNGLRLEGHLNWFILSNGARGTVAGRPVTVMPGDWLCVPPGLPLDFQPLQAGHQLRLLRFRVHLWRRNQELRVPETGFLISGISQLQSAASRLIVRANSQATGFPRQLSLRAQVAALYAQAGERLLESSPSETRLANHEVALIQELAYGRHAEQLGADFLARRLGWRPAAFAKAFRTYFGQTPRTWLADQRLRRAAELLLTTNATASAVAESCGFSDPFHFNRRFRKVIGCGTREWRKRHHG